MEGLRQIRKPDKSALEPCSRCGSAGCPWDRIAGHAMCPDCQETLALGDGPPLRARVESASCAICQRSGTLRDPTYPLHCEEPIEIDLCGGHFEALLSRRLERPHFAAWPSNCKC